MSVVLQDIATAPENRTVLLYIALRHTGEKLGFDIGYLEDGDWMLQSHDGDPSETVVPTHWCPLPDEPPEKFDA